MRQLKKKEASTRRMMLRIGVATIVGVISIALSIHYMKLGMVSHPSPSDMGFVDYIRYMLHQSCNRYEIYSMLLWAIGGAALLYAILLTNVKLIKKEDEKKNYDKQEKSLYGSRCLVNRYSRNYCL